MCHEDNIKLNDLIHADQFSADFKCIMGDFNFHNIDWLNCEGKDAKSKAFYNTLSDHFFIQNVCEPTRHRDGQTSNLLDLILANDENVIDSVIHIPPIGKSDHDVLINFMI